MKVADVTDFFSDRGGGIRSHLLSKARHLVDHGVEHVVIAPGKERHTELLLESPRASARIERLPGPAQPYDHNYRFLPPARTRDLLLRERPSVIELQSHYLAAAAALPRLSTGRPPRTLFWHSDHVDIWVKPVAARWLPAPFARRVTDPLWAAIRQVAERCEATIVTSEDQADKLKGHGFPRVVKLPLGVDRAVFHPGVRTSSSLAELRAEWVGTLPPGTQVIVAIGRLTPDKRWNVLLDAVARLLAIRQREGKGPLVVALAGDGPERGRLEEQAKRLVVDVRFLGFVRERSAVARLLAMGDLAIHPCPTETFGLGVAEAIATGTPIVVSDRGAARESVFGPSSRIFTTDDAAHLAEQARALLDADPTELRTHALEAASRVRTEEDHFRELLELYRSLGAR